MLCIPKNGIFFLQFYHGLEINSVAKNVLNQHKKISVRMLIILQIHRKKC